MKSVESYKLYDINLPVRKWKVANSKRPFNRGSFGEMVRDVSEDTGIDHRELYSAINEVFNDVYQDQYYSNTAFAGWPVIDDYNQGCERVRNNLGFWNDFYKLGLQILEANPLSVPPLYPYQKNAYDAADPSKSGKIIMPTGSGKTWVQADVINNKVASAGGGKAIVVLTPRIALNGQQVTEYFFRLIAHNNKPYRFMCVQSSNIRSDFLQRKAREKNVEIPEYDFVTTTDPSEIRDEYRKARENGQNLVVVSTYHSADRISEAIDVDFVTCDEAHHVATESFYLNADETSNNNVQIQNAFDCPYHYYTATPRNREDGFGMDHEQFGELFHEVPPLDLINQGFIVPPEIYEMYDAEDQNNDPYKSDNAALVDIWNRHYNEDASGYTAKLMVQAKSRRQIESMGKYIVENKDQFDGNPTVFRISTEEYGEDDWGPYIDNTYVVSKEDWIDEVRSYEGEAIIIHYDMLSEGLDVPGISGTTFFRAIGSSDTDVEGSNRSAVKIMQTLGRVMRILPEDRNKEDLGDYTKKKAFVYIPNIQDGDYIKKTSLARRLVEIYDDIYDGNIPEEMRASWSRNNERGMGGDQSDVDIDGVESLLDVAYRNLVNDREALEIFNDPINSNRY